METKGELDLQQWQRDILAMEHSKDYLNTAKRWQSICNTMERDKEITLTQSQRNMLEKVIGDDFYIGDTKIRETLDRVLDCGLYYEGDRATLNLARDCYLKGKNWIKKNE
tara:strand:- start:98 stop:427 length:330 start_codon:yes stop_codon:yes gene_type:complete